MQLCLRSFPAMAYSIVEFQDGNMSVPTHWLSQQKDKCKYPKDDTHIRNKIIGLEDPESDWEEIPVVRFFETASMFSYFFT